MAALRDHLMTMDQKCLIELCRRISNCIKNENIVIAGCTNEEKEILADWISSAMNRKEIMKAVVLSCRIAEYMFIQNLIDSEPFIEDLYRLGGAYWERLGLIRQTEMCTELTAFIRSQENTAFMREVYIASHINGSVCAMVNLYGIVPFEKAFELYNRTPFCVKANYDVFIKTMCRFSALRSESGILLYNGNFTTNEYIRGQFKSGIRRLYPQQAYYELISKQGNKPYYIADDIGTLICYEQPENGVFYEYRNAFTEFLSETLHLDHKSCMKIASEIYQACRNERSINEIFDMLSSNTAMPDCQKIQKTLVKYIMDIKNSVRIRMNRGYSINELRNISYDSNAICSNL